MNDGKNIHPDFTEELQGEGENLGFSWEQVQKGIENGGLEPDEARLALFLKERGHIAEMVDDVPEDLRNEYNEAIKNEEKLKRESKSKEKKKVVIKKIVASSERSGINIHPDFTPTLIQRWQECGFDYEEAREGINIGMGVTDAEFCAWLRDMKEVDAKGVLDHGNNEKLRSEYQEYCLLIAQQTQSSL